VWLANVDSSRSAPADWHFGQTTAASASCMRRSCSKVALQLEHRYS
jgi:hypothetical protein